MRDKIMCIKVGDRATVVAFLRKRYQFVFFIFFWILQHTCTFFHTHDGAYKCFEREPFASFSSLTIQTNMHISLIVCYFLYSLIVLACQSSSSPGSSPQCCCSIAHFWFIDRRSQRRRQYKKCPCLLIVHEKRLKKWRWPGFFSTQVSVYTYIHF